MQGSPNLPIVQMAVATSTVGMTVALRRSNNIDEPFAPLTWTPWRLTMPFCYFSKILTDADLGEGVELKKGTTGSSNSYNENHIMVENGTIEFGFNLTTTAELTAGTKIASCILPTYGRGVYFTMYDVNTKTPYFFIAKYSSTTGEHWVENTGKIPAGCNLRGNVSYTLYPFNSLNL